MYNPPKCPDCGSFNYTTINSISTGTQKIICKDCGALISEKSIIAENPIPSGQILHG